VAEYLLTENQIKAAEAVLRQGDRVLLIPIKDGVRIMRTRQEEIKIKQLISSHPKS